MNYRRFSLPDRPESNIQPPVVYVRSEIVWEYHVLVQDLEKDGTPSEEKLNELGKEGWELATVMTHVGKAHYTFKRMA